MINWLLCLVVQGVSVSSLYKQLLDAFDAPVLFVGLDRVMQRCEPLGVLSVDLPSPGDDIIECEVSAGESCPMKWSALPIVK